MALERQDIIVPLAKGLDQKTDEKHVSPDKLANLENGQFDKVGTINKRSGTETIDAVLDEAGTSWDKCQSLHHRQRELLQICRQINTARIAPAVENGWKSYSLDTEADEWRQIGRCTPVKIELDSIAKPEIYNVAPDMAFCNGYKCFVWASDAKALGGLTRHCYVTVVEEDTGSVVLDRYSLGPIVYTPKVLTVDNSFHIWVDGVGLSMIDTDVDPTAPSAFVAKAVGTIHADNLWDVCTVPSGPGGVDCSVIAYKDNSAPPDIQVLWFREDGTQVGNMLEPSTPFNVLSCAKLYDRNAGDYYVGIFWQANAPADIYGRLLDQDAGGFHWAAVQIVNTQTGAGGETAKNITAIQDPSIDITVPANSSFRVFIEVDGVFPPWSNYVRQGIWRFDMVGATAHAKTFNCACLASKAFNYRGQAFVWATNAQVFQCAMFLMSNKTDYPVVSAAINTNVKALRSEGQSYSTGYPRLPEVNGRPIYAYSVATVRRERLGAQGLAGVSDLFDAKSIVELRATFEGEFNFDSVEIDQNLVFAPGMVNDCDGTTFEAGFHLWPELDPTPANWGTPNVAGGFMSDGIELFRITYEWSDREGQIHRSAPSPVYAITFALGGANQRYAFNIPTLNYLNKAPTVKIWVYRQASDGLYHKEDVYQGNDNSVPYVTGFSGGVTSDINILDNELLYTDGGIVENIGPPAANILAASRNRVFIVPSEDPLSVWFSKEKKDGEGLAFNDTFIKRFPKGGPITALGVMDDKVVVFKEDEIWAFSGNGPSDSAQGGFSTETLIAQDIGCEKNSRGSVQNTEFGIVFNSKRGLYMLDRGLNPTYIGSALDDTKAEIVTDSISIPEKNQIRFMQTPNLFVPDPSLGVLDVLTKQCSRFDIDALHGTYWEDNGWVFSDPSWVIKKEVASHKDDANFIDMNLETSWIKLNGLQGYQRVFWVGLMGEYKSAHTLNIEVSYDYKAVVSETKTFTIAAADDPYQIRFRPKYSRCQAIKLKIYDSAQAGTGESLSLSGIHFVIGVKRGLYRDKPSKTL